MKKFILFSFLSGLIVCHVQAQDGGDEFADPTFQTVPVNTTPTPTPNTTSSTSAPIPTFNEIQSQPLPSTGTILLEKQPDLNQSYKERRGKHGVLFSIMMEQFYPTDYFSQYRDVSIDKIIGSSQIHLVGGELGYKYNFSLGSLSLLAHYVQGSQKANIDPTTGKDSNTAKERNIQVARYGASINYAADNMMQEPWIVPYVQGGIHQFQVTEDNLGTLNGVEVTDGKTTTTGISFNYRFGVMFQLNWIENALDPNSHLEGLRGSGLQNTFLDIYAITHMASSEVYSPNDANSSGDPDMASAMEIGVGLKMEF